MVYVRHADDDDMSEETSEDAKRFHPDLAPRAGEPMIDKTFMTSFILLLATER